MTDNILSNALRALSDNQIAIAAAIEELVKGVEVHGSEQEGKGVNDLAFRRCNSFFQYIDYQAGLGWNDEP